MVDVHTLPLPHTLTTCGMLHPAVDKGWSSKQVGHPSSSQRHQPQWVVPTASHSGGIASHGWVGSGLASRARLAQPNTSPKQITGQRRRDSHAHTWHVSQGRYHVDNRRVTSPCHPAGPASSPNWVLTTGMLFDAAVAHSRNLLMPTPPNTHTVGVWHLRQPNHNQAGVGAAALLPVTTTCREYRQAPEGIGPCAMCV